jgi:hypothetical protein
MSVRSRTGVLGKGTPRVPPPGGTTLPDGTAQGQILFWDVATQSYVLTAAPSDGQVFRYNATTGLVEPVTLQTGIIMFGAQQINTGATFLYPGYADGGVSAANIAASGARTAIRAGRLRRMKVRHTNPLAGGDVVYTLWVGGAPTALTATLSTAAAGPASDLVNVVSVANDAQIALQASKAAAGIQAIRAVVEMEWVSP